MPPLVVALIAVNGKDDAEGIHDTHLTLLKMADRVGLKVLALAADGASAELAAQELMDKEITDFPPLTYEYPLYGIHLRCPVLSTGPCVSLSDCPHCRKTARNQPQYGTHTACMGCGYLVNRSLVDLCKLPDSGLMQKDVDNVDKQDDGAARRVFHTQALDATTYVNEAGKCQVKEDFTGLFVYLFIFGI